MVKISTKSQNFVIFGFFFKQFVAIHTKCTWNIHRKKIWNFVAIFGNNNLRGKTQLSFFTLFFLKRLYSWQEAQSAQILGRPDQQIRMFLTKKNLGVVPQILTIIWGVHGGAYALSNRDVVPFYAGRRGNTEKIKKTEPKYVFLSSSLNGRKNGYEKLCTFFFEFLDVVFPEFWEIWFQNRGIKNNFSRAKC